VRHVLVFLSVSLPACDQGGLTALVEAFVLATLGNVATYASYKIYRENCVGLMFSTIAAVIAWISSIISLFLQSWLLVKNRSVLKAVHLWQTAAIGIFIAVGITFGYSLILISPELNNLGQLVIRLLIPPIMVSLVLGVWWSIQAAKFMQQQQEIIQQKMDFISLATHELGTPLTSILGYAELLNRVNLPQEAQTYLDGLYTGTARLRVIKRYNDALQKA
jgi:signal transduction histidine kinase